MLGQVPHVPLISYAIMIVSLSATIDILQCKYVIIVIRILFLYIIMLLHIFQLTGI